jgi:putative dehydrogenase
MVTVAVIAMGEMGSAVAHRLVENGARVVTSLAGRTAASADRAAAAGVEAVSEEQLVAECEMILSIVPPASAPGTAERFLPLIEASANKPVFIDCNAIAPQTLHGIAQPYLDRGLRFGDASIIGWAPKPDYSPHVYMSGAIAAEAGTLGALGLETRLMSGSLGDASAVKMAYAGITKGIQAIAASMALGAARSGGLDAFVTELSETQPGLYAWFAKMLPSMPAKAYRWDDEMQEIARFLEPERGAADMLRGAATLYRDIAAQNAAGPDAEPLEILRRFLRPAG